MSGFAKMFLYKWNNLKNKFERFWPVINIAQKVPGCSFVCFFSENIIFTIPTMLLGHEL